MSADTSIVIPIPLGMVQAFLITGERTILVDTGNPGSAEKIKAALTAHDIQPDAVSLILITHCHNDHFGSLPEMQAYTGAKVAIHAAEAEMLAAARNVPFHPVNGLGRFLNALFPKTTKVKGAPPDVTIQEELDLQEFGVAGKVIATPGHTFGSVSIVLNTGEALIGDLLMGSPFNTTRPTSYFKYALDMNEVKRWVRVVMQYQPRIVYPSHGGPFDPQDITTMLE